VLLSAAALSLSVAAADAPLAHEIDRKVAARSGVIFLVMANPILQFHVRISSFAIPTLSACTELTFRSFGSDNFCYGFFLPRFGSVQ
jgi:hypothetical protein